MQDLGGTIKRPNLLIMDIEEEEKIQAKGIISIFSQVIAENF
jgi:hypothetical protein